MYAVRGTSIWAVMLTWSALAGAVTAPRAETSVERGYSLQYRAPASCPDAAALAQAIESRTPGAVQQGPEVASVQLRVELRDDGTSTLWVDLPEGGSRREFPQASCTDAVASMALIAAMVLEADASERAATVQSVMDRLEPAAPSAEPAAAASAPSASLPSAAAPAPGRKPEREPAPRRKPQREPAPTSEASRFRLALAAGPLLESAVGSDAGLGANVGITAWLEPHRASLWLPSIRLEAMATLPATIAASQGEVELRLTAGRLHVCPLRWPLGASLRLVPCLTGDVGVLTARGTGTTVNPQAPSMPWLALGGTVRAQLALGRNVDLESWLGLRGLARADTFVFGPPKRPDSTAYQVPSWSLGAGLGLTVALP